MSYRDWHVGMKVVCVDASGWEHRLQQGAVYTLSAIGSAFGGLYIGLVETPSETGPLHWYARRFRPVQPRKTDISIFEAMLTGAKEREPA